MNNSIKKKRYTRCCCVVSCKSRVSEKKGIHFYSFPNRHWEIERKKKWIAAVRRTTIDGKPWVPTKHSVICSLHFVGGEKSNNPYKDAYIPTIFPSCYGKKTTYDSDREKRAENRRNKKETPEIINEIKFLDKLSNQQMEDKTVHNQIKQYKDIGIQTDAALFETVLLNAENEDAPNMLYCELNLSTCQAGTQTKIIIKPWKRKSPVIIEKKVEPVFKEIKQEAVVSDNFLSPSFLGFKDINDNRSIKALCGVSLSFFHSLLQFIKLNSDNQPRYYRVLTSENRLLLFFMKMKLGLSFLALGSIFKVSNKTASTIFFNVLEILYEQTKSWIFWPSKIVIKEMLPKSFKNYPNCRAIIDCVEICIDTPPPTVKQRVQMFSSSKSTYTVKFLISFSPSGQIIFVSKGYDGNVSDGFITNDSGFLQLLDKDDVILADKSFPVIKAEMLKRQCTLVMPPFDINSQFIKEKVLDGSPIASIRRYVERVVQRVKIFNILQHVNIECLRHIEKIMYVACVLANDKEPLKAASNK